MTHLTVGLVPIAIPANSAPNRTSQMTPERAPQNQRAFSARPLHVFLPLRYAPTPTATNPASIPALRASDEHTVSHPEIELKGLPKKPGFLQDKPFCHSAYKADKIAAISSIKPKQPLCIAAAGGDDDGCKKLLSQKAPLISTEILQHALSLATANNRHNIIGLLRRTIDEREVASFMDDLLRSTKRGRNAAPPAVGDGAPSAKRPKI